MFQILSGTQSLNCIHIYFIETVSAIWTLDNYEYGQHYPYTNFLKNTILGPRDPKCLFLW